MLNEKPKKRITKGPANSFNLSGTVLLAAVFLASEIEQRLLGTADRFSAYCNNPVCCNNRRLYSKPKQKNQYLELSSYLLVQCALVIDGFGYGALFRVSERPC